MATKEVNLGSVRGPQGAAATVTVGKVTTGEAGTTASVTNSGTSGAAVLNFTIPRGAQGVQGKAATVSVGKVTTGEAGSGAAVANSGTDEAAVFDFTIPRGPQGNPTTVNGKSGASITLTKADMGLSNVDNTPDAQKNVKGLAVEETDVITGLPTGLYYYKANTPGAPKTVDGLLLALVYAPFGVQLAFPTNSGIYFRWAVDNFSEWVRLDQ